MAQTLPAVGVDDFRARIDADPAYADDALLQSYLDQARAVVGGQLDAEGDFTGAANVAEAIAQIAVKLWDMRSRGLGSSDLMGDVGSTAMPATAGLVRSVYGLLLPSMRQGGITV